MSKKLSNTRSSCGGKRCRRVVRIALLTLFIAQILMYTSRAQMPLPATPLNSTRNAVTTATREGRRAVFEDVWTTIAERYYDSQLHGLDWQKIGAQFRSVAINARDEQEFYAVIEQMVDALDDSHTRVYSPVEKSDWSHPKLVSIGFNVREINGEIVVTKLVRASEAERAGLRAGDVVTRIDGEDVREIVARRVREESLSSTNDKNGENYFSEARKSRRIIARLFHGAPNSSLTVTFSSGVERHTRTLKLRRTLIELEPKVSATFFDKRKQLALVEFRLFTSGTAAELARLMREDLKHARGIIFDMRANGGGDSEAMTDVASIFLPAGTRLGSFIDRNGRVVSEPQTRAKFLYTADDLKPFHGALVILTGERAASAAEIFVAAMQAEKRAVVIGETTCGCVLGVRRRYTLPDGGALDISEMDYRTARGVRLENTGITPDILIASTRADLAKQSDHALDHALFRLKTDK